MKNEYHPVSLHVLRGALEFAGFQVLRIRCTKPATEVYPWADYRIDLGNLNGILPRDITPSEVRNTVNSAFASDVNVREIEYVKRRYTAIVRTQTTSDQVPFDHEGDVINAFA